MKKLFEAIKAMSKKLKVSVSVSPDLKCLTIKICRNEKKKKQQKTV